MVIGRIKCLLLTVCLASIYYTALPKPTVKGQNNAGLLYPNLVNKFYSLHPQICWYTGTEASIAIRNSFLDRVDGARYLGLNKEKYHYPEIKASSIPKDSLELMKQDRIFTDAVIAYCKDVYQGAAINSWIKNDEISGKYAVADEGYLLDKIVQVNSAAALSSMLTSLEPGEKEYSLLKLELAKQIAINNTHLSNQLRSCLNLYRWIHHFHFEKFIVVNIPSVTLQYYEQDSMKLQMKVVVGKLSTKSPRFSTWCYQVVLYPYWNVPRDIGVKELLPHFKKSLASLESMHMEVIGSNGKPLNPYNLNWAGYTRSNFPYTFRQCTGCDNSLGVIKFNLTDPFNVYLHDTNFKIAFLKDTRFLSHGCIRVEKPIELGNYLLNNKLDSNFLKACVKNQDPIPVNLDKKVPVFVVYMPVVATGDSTQYYKDIYRLF